MPRLVHILANPIAGGGRGGRIAPQIRDELESRGIHAELRLTTKAGDAHDFAAELDPATHHACVVVGGDGTINEVLNGLQNPGLPMAVAPLGTGNVLGCELGLRADPVRVAEAIDRGRTVRAAIGRAGDRRFLICATFGVDARMVHRLDEVRTGTAGKLKWVGPAVHVLRHWPRDELRFELANGAVHEGFSAVLVTRVRNYGGVLRLMDTIDIQDGTLHVLGFRQRGRAAYLAAAWRGFRGALRPGKDVETFTTDALRVTSMRDTPVPAQVDGDPHGTTPSDIALTGDFAQILVPEP